MRNTRAKRLRKVAKYAANMYSGEDGLVQGEVRDKHGNVYQDRGMLLHRPHSWKSIYRQWKKRGVNI